MTGIDFSDLSAGEVRDRYWALKPAARKLFAAEVFCYGSGEQSDALSEVAYPDNGIDGTQLDLFGGGA